MLPIQTNGNQAVSAITIEQISEILDAVYNHSLKYEREDYYFSVKNLGKESITLVLTEKDPQIIIQASLGIEKLLNDKRGVDFLIGESMRTLAKGYDVIQAERWEGDDD